MESIVDQIEQVLPERLRGNTCRRVLDLVKKAASEGADKATQLRLAVEEWQKILDISGINCDIKTDSQQLINIYNNIIDPHIHFNFIQKSARLENDAARLFIATIDAASHELHLSTNGFSEGDMTAAQIVFIGLLLAGAGVGLWYLLRHKTSGTGSPAPQTPSTFAHSGPAILVVVMPANIRCASGENMCTGLVTPEYADLLQGSCKWYWFGLEDTYKTDIERLLDDPKQSILSEYDICMVSIRLRDQQAAEGYFGKSAGLINRMDGFKRLPALGAEAIKVSSRRPADAFHGHNFTRM